jgi:hypothetical protein
MDDLWTNALNRRYASVLDQYERAIRLCPDDLWEASLWEVKKTDPFMWPIRRAGTKSASKSKAKTAANEALLQVHSQFWNVAYHALFHIDFYLAGADRKGFAPPPPFQEIDHHGNVVPQRTYTRDELSMYVAYDRSRARDTLEGLTPQQAEKIAPRAGVPFGEFLLSTLQHSQEHSAQLNLFLGQHGVEPPGGKAAERNRQFLFEGVRFSSDRQIDSFARMVGGYPRLLPLVFAGMCANIHGKEDMCVVFDVGAPFPIEVKGGRATVPTFTPDEVVGTVTMSPQDYLRWVTGDLDRDAAFASGRMQLEGDKRALKRFFAMFRAA